MVGDLDVTGDTSLTGEFVVTNAEGGKSVGNYDYAIDYETAVTGVSYSNANFYPVVLDLGNPSMPNGGLYQSFEFEIVCDGHGWAEPYNSQSLKGHVSTGGWSDHSVFYDIQSKSFDTNESRISSVYRGTQASISVAIYLRGGYKYSIRTDARVTKYTSDSVGGITHSNSAYCRKIYDGTDSPVSSATIQTSSYIYHVTQGVNVSKEE